MGSLSPSPSLNPLTHSSETSKIRASTSPPPPLPQSVGAEKLGAKWRYRANGEQQLLRSAGEPPGKPDPASASRDISFAVISQA